MLIFLILCLGYGKLILQGKQNNECKNYIMEIEENSQIILKSDDQNCQIFLDTQDPCNSQLACKPILCNISKNQLVGINCTKPCNFQVHQIQNSDLIEIDKESYYIMDNDVIYLKFSSQSQLINSKYLVFESELVNPQQNWDNLFYNLSVQYSDTEIFATKARMGAQLIEVEVDSTLLYAENILIKLLGQKGSSFKIYTHAYTDIRKIKLFQNIDEIIVAQTVKTYQLDYSQLPDLHKNKDLFVKINIQSGIVDFCINIAEIPQRISDSQWFVNTNEVSEIIIHKQDIQSANYIYIMIYGIESSTYTLKLNIEGEIQYIDSGEIVMGKLYPNTILQGFQFYKNEQNLFSSIMIEKIGDFDLAVLDCKLYVTCNIEEQYWNQDNSHNQTSEYNYLLIKDQIDTIHIQNQYLSFGIIATKPHIVDFQLKIVGKDAIISLKENTEFHHSSTTSSRTTYQYQIQKQTEFSIDKIYIHLIKHYGLISLDGEYYRDQITMDNVVSGQTINFDVVCLHACDYSVNFQITRNYQDSIGSQAILLDTQKILKLKIEDELFFELPNLKKGYFALLITCQDQLMIQQINKENITFTDRVQNIQSNIDRPILLTQNCYYLRIYTQIPQIIQITLINHQIYRIQMNEDVINQIDKFDKIVYTYYLSNSSNATILLKSLNNQIALNIYVMDQNKILYEEEAVQSIIHVPAQSDSKIEIHLSTNHSTAFYLKVQENSEFYYYSFNSLKLFVEQDHVKIINLSRLRNLLTYSVMFDKPVPFIIYFNYRDAGVNEFPNQTHYDHMSYHRDSIFQYQNNYELQGSGDQQLILIQFSHVVNQVLTFQISKIMKVQPNNEIYLPIRKGEIVYFEIDTYTNVPQFIFMFGYHQKALFLLEKGCNKTIQKQDFNYGYDLLREANIEFSNITKGCYIGGIYNPNDNLININFQWLQQSYLIHDYINNTVMTKQATDLTTFFYIDPFDGGKITFYPYEGCLKIIQVPIFGNELPQEISLLENNDSELDYKICNISCTISSRINEESNKLGMLIKVMFQQTKTYTIFMEDQVYNRQLQFEGTVLFQKSLNEDSPDLFKLVQQQSKLILYIRTITGQLQLTILYENEYSYESLQINKEMQQLDLVDKNCTIELNKIGSKNTIYEIQTQQENIKLKFGQLYFGNNQKIIFTLPLVDYEQNITYSVSVYNQQLCDCQIQIKIWNRLTQIYSHSTNQSSVIESLPLDLNQHQMEVDFQCDPPQYEGYYVYIQPAYTHLSMVMINTEIQFNTESKSNDVYFVNIEQLGFVVLEVTQLKGQIIAYATRNVNMIYNGISELWVQTIDNFHYKLILEVDSWGILYFGIKCISQIKCEYLINVKQVNSLTFNLNDIKLGKAEYNYQSKNLTINSSIQVSNKLKTERFGIYYDNLKVQADKYINGEDSSIILNDFSGQQLFVEMEFSILDSDYSSKLMYDPIIIVQQHTVIVQSQSYISYIVMVILLIFGLGLFLYIVQLKKKLKYEMSDARNLVNRNNEIELNSQ